MVQELSSIVAERGHLKVMLGNEDVPMDALDIDQKVETKYLFPDENDRKQKDLARMRNQKGYRDLQLLCPSWPFHLYLLQRQKSFQMDP